jgi:hypothetical protein
VTKIRKFHEISDDDELLVRDRMAKIAEDFDDVARMIADLDERLAKIESFQRQQAAAKVASDELRKRAQ